ncbi:SRPBCC family protein [Puia dinghuensis]|uniref:SRPBCC family protein n=1 Tax=Puia dinghuensis TaxID=1792502 RepID=UPI0016642DEB|nr:SRPBCC family protein [Puia dinghuensis]
MKKKYLVEKTSPVHASARHIFNILLRLERWNLWTQSVTGISTLNNASVEVGTKLRVLQPKLSPAIWIITKIDQDKILIWEKRSLGLKMISEHLIHSDANETKVTIRMNYEGPLAGLIYQLTRSLTNRYMTMEINGLKKESEKL